MKGNKEPNSDSSNTPLDHNCSPLPSLLQFVAQLGSRKATNHCISLCGIWRCLWKWQQLHSVLHYKWHTASVFNEKLSLVQTYWQKRFFLSFSFFFLHRNVVQAHLMIGNARVIFPDLSSSFLQKSAEPIVQNRTFYCLGFALSTILHFGKHHVAITWEKN